MPATNKSITTAFAFVSYRRKHGLVHARRLERFIRKMVVPVPATTSAEVSPQGNTVSPLDNDGRLRFFIDANDENRSDYWPSIRHALVAAERLVVLNTGDVVAGEVARPGDMDPNSPQPNMGCFEKEIAWFTLKWLAAVGDPDAKKLFSEMLDREAHFTVAQIGMLRRGLKKYGDRMSATTAAVANEGPEPQEADASPADSRTEDADLERSAARFPFVVVDLTESGDAGMPYPFHGVLQRVASVAVSRVPGRDPIDVWTTVEIVAKCLPWDRETVADVRKRLLGDAKGARRRRIASLVLLAAFAVIALERTYRLIAIKDRTRVAEFAEIGAQLRRARIASTPAPHDGETKLVGLLHRINSALEDCEQVIRSDYADLDARATEVRGRRPPTERAAVELRRIDYEIQWAEGDEAIAQRSAGNADADEWRSAARRYLDRLAPRRERNLWDRLLPSLFDDRSEGPALRDDLYLSLKRTAVELEFDRAVVQRLLKMRTRPHSGAEGAAGLPSAATMKARWRRVAKAIDVTIPDEVASLIVPIPPDGDESTSPTTWAYLIPDTGEFDPQCENEDAGIVLSLIPRGVVRLGGRFGGAVGHRESSRVPENIELEPFLISRFETTQAQWDLLMDEDPSEFCASNRMIGSVRASKRHPVETVDYWQACEFASRAAGRFGALPTEAQWMRTTTWTFDDETLGRLMTETDDDLFLTQFNLRGSNAFPEAGDRRSASRPVDYDGHEHHGPVGALRPAGLVRGEAAVCDLVGNVAEWCADRIGDFGSGAIDDGTGLRAVATSALVLAKGGSYRTVIDDARPSRRTAWPPGRKDGTLGCRIVVNFAQ